MLALNEGDRYPLQIRLSGERETLELKRVMFDNVSFEGFSRGLKVGRVVLIGDMIRIINSEFANAKNELEVPGGKIQIDGKDLSQL